jgi:D-glycero-D-manno-heptose 1,7-bisphosphate phosphatase
MRPAIFLDRDGVLNRVVWREGKPASPRSLEEVEIEADAPAALARLKDAGYLLFAVTNQPDVRRGKMSRSALDQIHHHLAAQLPLCEIAACVHDDRDACDCRKPKPGLVVELARRHGLDLGRSWVVGDQDRDTASAAAAGCRAVLLARSYNSGAGAEHVVDTLTQAVDLMMRADPAPSPKG